MFLLKGKEAAGQAFRYLQGSGAAGTRQHVRRTHGNHRGTKFTQVLWSVIAKGESGFIIPFQILELPSPRWEQGVLPSCSCSISESHDVRDS